MKRKQIMKNTTTPSTSKKRLFYAGNYYVVGKDNIVFYSGKTLEDIATKFKQLEPTDTILFAMPISALEKFVKTSVTKMTLDFTNNKMLLEGDGSVTLAKCEYEVGEYTLEPDELKDWSQFITDAKRQSIEVVVVGTPPIEGTYLEY